MAMNTEVKIYSPDTETKILDALENMLFTDNATFNNGIMKLVEDAIGTENKIQVDAHEFLNDAYFRKE